MENRDEAGVETTAIAELVSLDRKRVLDVGRSSDYFVAAVHTWTGLGGRRGTPSPR